VETAFDTLDLRGLEDAHVSGLVQKGQALLRQLRL
jgi:hypothetical protein